MATSSVRQCCYVGVMSLMLCACLGRATPESRILWPPPPSQPRMEFVGTFASADDFPKDRWQQFLESFLGEAPAEIFQAPSDIYVDDWGKVYISDLALGNIVVFDFKQKAVKHLFTPPPFFPSPVEEPLGLVRDNVGNFYIVDREKTQILVFSDERVFLRAFGDDNLLPSPQSLAFDPKNERLYVSDRLASKIVVFDLQGRHLFSFGQHGKNAGEFDEPHGLAIDGRNRLYVADSNNARIQVFDENGNYLYHFGERGFRAWHFKKPIDLSFDSDGHLYVLDQEMRALFTYHPAGELLLATGTGKPSKQQLGLLNPTALHIDNRDRIYIADQGNRRFTVWQYLSAPYLRENPLSVADRQKSNGHIATQQKEP